MVAKYIIHMRITAELKTYWILVFFSGRMQESSIFMSSSGQRCLGVTSYSSLTDKHLQDYFMKKFVNPRPPSAVSTEAWLLLPWSLGRIILHVCTVCVKKHFFFVVLVKDWDFLAQLTEITWAHVFHMCLFVLGLIGKLDRQAVTVEWLKSHCIL